MEMLQAHSSNVQPAIGASRPLVKLRRTARPEGINSRRSRLLNSDKTVAQRGLGKEWAVVQQAIAGNAIAHEQLFTRHTGRLYRIAFALMLMARRRKNLHPEASLDEILESEPAQLPLGAVDSKPDPEKIYAEMESNAFVEEHLRQLPTALQAAFRLRAIYGLSAKEAGQALGIPACAVKSQVFRARRKLACKLQQSPRFAGAFEALLHCWER